MPPTLSTCSLSTCGPTNLNVLGGGGDDDNKRTFVLF